MNKSTQGIALLFALVLSACLACCSSTKQTGTNLTDAPVSAGERLITITMYDNCPNETAAHLAEIALKSAHSGYDGSTTLSYTGRTPTRADMQPARQYYSYCQSIKSAITKGSNRLCNLSFNTSRLGTDIALDFSNDDAIFESLVKMAAYNRTTVYAIYSY